MQFSPWTQYKNLYVTHRVKFLYLQASKFDLKLLELWAFPPFNILKINKIKVNPFCNGKSR